MLGAGTALAATHTVTVSGAPASGAVSAASGTTTLKDTRNGAILTCTSSSAKGIVKNQKTTGTFPIKIGTITNTLFNSCTGPAGLKFTVKQNGTWNLAITGTTSSGGVTSGGVTGASATLTGTACTATVTGSAQGTFTNASGTKKPVLAFSPTSPNPNGFALKIASASCLGILATGDTVQYTGTYTVSQPVKVISI